MDYDNKTLDDFLKTTPILSSNNKKGLLIKLTFNEFSYILNNSKENNLKVPDIQKDIDEDKVTEICECYDKNPQFFISKSIITIAYINNNNENEYYLLDGQHRSEAIKKLKTNDTHDNVLISFQKLENVHQVYDLFVELNKDSKHNCSTISVLSSLEESMRLIELKREMTSKWSKFCVSSKSSTNHFYPMSEFFDLLHDNGYFNDYLENKLISDDVDEFKKDSVDIAKKEISKDIENIITTINNKHAKFFSKLNYFETADNDKKYFSDETKMIQTHKNMMFSKNNNFINFLVNNDPPYHEYRNKRSSITKTMKKEVWKKLFKNNDSGYCPIFKCKSELKRDIPYGFQCGHIISVSEGGKTIVSNMKPICGSCNNKMSGTNWDEYEEKIKRQYLWDKYEVDECENGKCTRKLTFENFKYDKNKKGKYYLICEKCHDKLNESDSESDSSSEDEKPVKINKKSKINTASITKI